MPSNACSSGRRGLRNHGETAAVAGIARDSLAAGHRHDRVAARGDERDRDAQRHRRVRGRAGGEHPDGHQQRGARQEVFRDVGRVVELVPPMLLVSAETIWSSAAAPCTPSARPGPCCHPRSTRTAACSPASRSRAYGHRQDYPSSVAVHRCAERFTRDRPRVLVQAEPIRTAAPRAANAVACLGWAFRLATW